MSRDYSTNSEADAAAYERGNGGYGSDRPSLAEAEADERELAEERAQWAAEQARSRRNPV